MWGAGPADVPRIATLDRRALGGIVLRPRPFLRQWYLGQGRVCLLAEELQQAQGQGSSPGGETGRGEGAGASAAVEEEEEGDEEEEGAGAMGVVVARESLHDPGLYRVGPLYVEGGRDMALCLLRRLVQELRARCSAGREQGQLRLAIMVPRPNQLAREVLLGEAGFREGEGEETFHLWRMYAHGEALSEVEKEEICPPLIPFPEVWGTASCELG